jgi:acetylornithine deacetylase
MNALEYTKNLVSFETPSSVSNAEVSDYAEDALRKIDFTTERIEYDDIHGVRKVNIVGKKGSGTGGLAYFCHTDVVPADKWFTEEHGPFTPTVKGDRLYGRGSCDMKGSFGCMLAAAAGFSANDLKQPIYITATADEEIGFGGVSEVVDRSELYREMVEGASRGIVGEPTCLEVVYAHKGCYGLVATARGRAAHSSGREGINANLAMIPYLTEMKAIHDESESDPAWRNDEFDPPTITWNIGINDHTRAVNITPPQSVCTIYFRPMPGQDAQILIERSRQAAKANGLEFEVRVASDPLYTSPDSTFIQNLVKLAGKTEAHTVPYGTDGARLQGMQHLAVLGPGNIAQAHTIDEWIELDQLDRGTQLYGDLIRHWCC